MSENIVSDNVIGETLNSKTHKSDLFVIIILDLKIVVII